MSGRDKVSNHIAKRLKREVGTVFGVTGGCVVNLVDSMYKEGLSIVPMHHEQSASIAADAYARFTGFGCCYGTSGPGNTNLITGTACSYYDSVPVLTIGGQVPRKFLTGKDRQIGFQETAGVEIFKPITKYSKRMDNLEDLEDAIHYAKSGRQGPSFLEIPDDYQREEVESLERKKMYCPDMLAYFGQVKKDIQKAKKPLLIIGAGARDMDLKLEVPFLYTWGVKDKFYNHPYAKGDFGITGSPNGNRLTKESDLVVMIGTKMDTHQVPNWEDFAPQAKKIAVGLSFPHEVDKKYSGVLKNYSTIHLRGNDWGQREENTTKGELYDFIDKLSDEASPEDIIIPDMGQTGCIALQRWKVKGGQRLFNGFNHSPMGYSLPAAIGATTATGRPVKAIVGDGSFMMNLHDLATIGERKLPVEVYVVNNGGYGMIRQTQKDWEQYLNQDVACSFNFPNFERLGRELGVNVKEVNIKDTTISPKWKWGTKL